MAIALFLAVTAAAQTSEESEVITQTIMKGELTQTVFAGDEIDQVFIVYDNIVDGVHQSEVFLDLGLVIKWNGPMDQAVNNVR